MEKYSYRRERKGSSNPSFSSTLLDTIYRSIDEGGEEELLFYRETMGKKQQICSSFKDDEEMANFQRICMIEKWMEKKQSQRRRSLPDFRLKASDYINDKDGFFFKSSSSSSDSSSNNGGFSSTEVSSGFTKAKSRALKIYGDLKKSKQPVSPGAKLASFLNSLLNNTKKSKKISSRRGYNDDEIAERKSSKSANSSSTCSSASSFSRSCLSKTPSSRGKSSNSMKRSVRFYPVSVVVDEDCQPCGHKNLYESKKSMEAIKEINRSSINEELKLHIMEKNRRVEEAARDLLRNYQKRVELEYDYSRMIHVKNEAFNNGDEEDDEDDASCASSDLFELDNLSAIGMERYQEELPVYETTRLDTNRAIVNGMIL